MHACFLLHEPEKNRNKITSRTCTYLLYEYYLDTARGKSNPTLWNHIFKLERQCRGPQRARKLLSLFHTDRLRVHRQVVRFGRCGCTGSYGRIDEGMPYNKNT